MKLKKCKSCGIYTLKENCPECGDKASDAHYKFVRIKGFEKRLFATHQASLAF